MLKILGNEGQNSKKITESSSIKNNLPVNDYEEIDNMVIGSNYGTYLYRVALYADQLYGK